MSSDAAEAGADGVPAEWDELELVVRRLLDQHAQWRRRAAEAEARVRELEKALDDYSSGRVNPLELGERLERLEAENRDLRERLESARGSVDRILGRLQFMEETS